MKLILSIFIVLLTGCAAAPEYRPASNKGFGYAEREIGDNRYRVRYKARGDERHKAMDYALLRAAEVTLLKGYDWFVVVNRETFVDKERAPASGISAGTGRTVTRECGLLGCQTRSEPRHQVGVNMQLGGDRSQVEVVLEIRLGKGPRPDMDSYDALEITETITP